MTNSTDDQRTAAAREMRRAYKREYDRQNREKNAEYTRNYWERQFTELETELGKHEAWELLELLKTAEGEELKAAIESALNTVENVPSGFRSVKP